MNGQRGVGAPVAEHRGGSSLPPRGWPRKPAEALWSWMARPRPPLPVLVVGAEGGVGTSTVCALVGEVLAAASPGPTVLVNHSGHAGSSAIRRLIGQEAGLPAQHVLNARRRGTAAAQVLRSAATSSAGAFLVDDAGKFTALRGLFDLVRTTCGGFVVDAGRVDVTTLLSVQEVRAVPVLVGRADVLGAEAVCAALRFLQHRPRPVRPVVVLSSTATVGRRRLRAALTLVRAANPACLVHLPFDARLGASAALRLDRVSGASVRAALEIATQVGRFHEGGCHGR